MITHLLELLGVHGRWLLLATLLLGLYHFREVLQIGAQAASGLRWMALFAVILGLGVTRLVPGYAVDLDPGTLLDLLDAGVDLGRDLLEVGL